MWDFGLGPVWVTLRVPPHGLRVVPADKNVRVPHGNPVWDPDP